MKTIIDYDELIRKWSKNWSIRERDNGYDLKRTRTPNSKRAHIQIAISKEQGEEIKRRLDEKNRNKR